MHLPQEGGGIEGVREGGHDTPYVGGINVLLMKVMMGEMEGRYPLLDRNGKMEGDATPTKPRLLTTFELPVDLVHQFLVCPFNVSPPIV